MLGSFGTGLDLCTDFVICIDASGRIAAQLDLAKKASVSLYEKYIEHSEMNCENLAELRIKFLILAASDSDSKTVVESRFFSLGERGEDEALNRFLSSVRVAGGVSNATNSLDLLARAFGADWSTAGSLRRHVTLLISDTEDNSDGVRRATDEIFELWDKMSTRYKRLVIFAPDAEPWYDIAAWDCVFTVPYDSGMLSDSDIDYILPHIRGT